MTLTYSEIDDLLRKLDIISQVEDQQISTREVENRSFCIKDETVSATAAISYENYAISSTAHSKE